MIIYSVGGGYDEVPLLCTTLEIAQREAEKIRTKQITNAANWGRYQNLQWIQPEQKNNGVVEEWDLWGDWYPNDGVTPNGQRFMVGPDLFIMEVEVLEA